MKVSNTSIELKSLVSEMKKGVSDIAKTKLELVHSVASMKEEVAKVANVKVELTHAISEMKGASNVSTQSSTIAMTKMQNQIALP
jgi:hypothetical protein